MQYGIALCEDVNSPLAEFHPRRMAWRQYFGKNGISLSFKNSMYVNGGYVGLSDKNRDFLSSWKVVQEAMAQEIGGLDRSSLTGKELPKEKRGPFAPFGKTDQDALNAAVEAWPGKVSLMGKDAMAFGSGTALMPHALGQPKPWTKKFVLAALDGRPPSVAEKKFWASARGIIPIYNPAYIKLKDWSIVLASFIGR